MARQTKVVQQQALFRRRIFYISAVVGLLFFVLVVRLISLTIFDHGYFEKQADLYRVSKNIIPASRGLLFDRTMNVLAANEIGFAVYADPLQVKDPAGTAAALAPYISVPEDRLSRLLIPKGPRNHYVSLARHLADDAANDLQARIKSLALLGVNIVPDTIRSYPNKTLASQILGFTDRDGNGVEGIESSQDGLLRGRDGHVTGEIDKQGRFIPGTLRDAEKARNGDDLVLTIDRTLQYEADTDLSKTVAEHHAKQGVVVVMDPNTGEILALSNAPGYDPNTPRSNGPVTKAQGLAIAAVHRDTAVADLYEPGSTLKAVTASAVLQTMGESMLSEHVFCSGSVKIGGHIVHCAKDPPTYGHHGDETMAQVMENSCNIGMAHFGHQLGALKLYDFEQLFGFFDRPDSGLPGESRTYLQSPTAFNKATGGTGWPAIKLANVAFGQGISVTPLQLTDAYCAIANGGILMQPHIIKAIRHNGVMTNVQPVVVRRVISEAVARDVRELLRDVVLHGTGQPGQIAGYSVGGKTGSAQVYGPHGYGSGGYVASFIGVVPLNHPRLVILCSVFQPQGEHWGATVAAPVVHDLEKSAMLQMHIPPDEPELLDWAVSQRMKRSGHKHPIATPRLGSDTEEL